MSFAACYPYYMHPATSRRLLRASRALRSRVLIERELRAALRNVPPPMGSPML